MFRTQPYHFFLLLIIVFGCLAIFSGDRTIDIHLHDTYYVIAFTHFYLASAIILATIWLLSVAFRKIFLSAFLSWVHVIAIIAFFAYVFYYLWQQHNSPRSYIDVSAWQRDALIQRIAVFSFLTGLLALLINMVGGVVTKFIRQRQQNSIP